MNKQKFIVGELVAVVSEEAPEWNISAVEVTLAEYTSTTSIVSGATTLGWRYRTAHMPEGSERLRFREESLRKLPKQGDSFEEMMNKLKTGVPA